MSKTTWCLIGVLIGFLLNGWLEWLVDEAQLPDELQYDAYRLCIAQSQCYMTPEDYLDYYWVKWRLEKKEQAQLPAPPPKDL